MQAAWFEPLEAIVGLPLLQACDRGRRSGCSLFFGTSCLPSYSSSFLPSFSPSFSSFLLFFFIVFFLVPFLVFVFVFVFFMPFYFTATSLQSLGHFLSWFRWRRCDGGDEVFKMVLSPNNQQLLTLHTSHCMCVWSVPSLRLLQRHLPEDQSAILQATSQGALQLNITQYTD